MLVAAIIYVIGAYVMFMVSICVVDEIDAIHYDDTGKVTFLMTVMWPITLPLTLLFAMYAIVRYAIKSFAWAWNIGHKHLEKKLS